MLRSVRLHNFVFEGTKSLIFDKGVNFFLGSSDSGKNCVFDAVQSCLTEESCSLDDEYVFDRTKPASILCYFEIPDPEAKGYSKAYILFGKNGHLKTQIRISAFVGKQAKMAIDAPVQLYWEGSLQAVEPYQSILRLLQKESGDYAQGIPDLLSTFPVLKATRKETIRIRKKYKATCRKLFAFVAIFSTQGFLRQTESGFGLTISLLDTLRHLLKQNLDHDENKERRYFKMLTKFRNIDISIEDDDLRIFEDDTEHGTKYLSSEVVGSKICSLLLSANVFHTILIENVGRYLDPASARLFREGILPEERKAPKTVILTSTQDDFVAGWTIPRTFVFRRKQRVLSIFEGSRWVKPEARSPILARLADKGQISQIIYADKVFLVEERADYLFLEQLFSLIANDDRHVLNILSMISTKQCDQTATSKSLKSFISSLTLVEAGDLASMAILREMCQSIEVKCFCLQNNSEPDAKRSKSSTKKEDSRSDIFVWEDGILEYMLYSLGSQFKEISSTEKQRTPVIFDKLKAKKVDLEEIVNEKNRKRRLYDNPNITYDNIRKSVQICLQTCKKSSQDLAKFIKFLIQCSRKL